MRDAIALRNAELLGRARDHFEHCAYWTARSYERLRKRDRMLGDPQNPTIATDEDHIEWNVGILHPERRRLLAMEVEQHALSFRQLAPKHQALGLLLRGDRHLHPEGMHPALAHDLERLELTGGKGARRAERGQGERANKNDIPLHPVAHPQVSLCGQPAIEIERPTPGRNCAQ